MATRAFRLLDTVLGDVVLPVFLIDGAPVNGTTLADVAPAGALLLRTDSAAVYQNTGTKASPTWTNASVSGAASVTTLTASGLVTAASLKVDTGTKTATASGTGATSTATLNKAAGTITTDAITTAAAAAHTMTITNSTITASSIVVASIANGTNSQGAPVITAVTPGSGSLVITFKNVHASEAINGTLKISFIATTA
jgi:hypothetical protein